MPDSPTLLALVTGAFGVLAAFLDFAGGHGISRDVNVALGVGYDVRLDCGA